MNNPVLETVVSRMAPDTKATASQIHRALALGELSGLRAMPREAVESLARDALATASLDEVAAVLAQTLNLPASYLTSRADPAGWVIEAFDAVTGQTSAADGSPALIVTDHCAPDGRVLGATQVIPAGSHRAYAVFENTHSLEGHRHVLAVWRDLGRDRLTFTQTEPLHPDSPYNHVWLELEDGWPAGRYRVELFDPEQPSQLLASQTFAVR